MEVLCYYAMPNIGSVLPLATSISHKLPPITTSASSHHLIPCMRRQAQLLQPASLQPHDMARSIKLTAAIFLFLLVAQVECQQGCTPSSISVQQTNTGKKMGGLDTVFEVTVTNHCRCAVKNVYLRSNGFSSSTPVDPKLFRLAVSGYLVGDGRQIPSSKSVTFQYAWDHYFKMAPASVQAQC